ncbi:MAG: DNA mismatch repair protein MutL, partial [Bradymonadaceae bacterium]
PPTIEGGTAGEEPPETIEDREEGRYFSTLRVLGQIKQAYIVCEDASGLVVVDQHAAHERIGFERLRRIYEREHDETQSMLFGQRLEFDAVRADAMAEYADFFEKAGFEVEHFGGQTWAVKSVPAVLEDADLETVVRDALDELADLGQTERLDEAMNAVLSRIACHSVVRGPTPLTDEECESLLEQMDEIDFRANCPHGRPVYYRMPLEELEKAFERS